MLYLRTGAHAIKKILNSGKTIILDDGSQWEVSLFDRLAAMLWLPTDKVTVKSYLGSKFKFERKTLSGKVEVIEATYLGS
jgi:hypothetical protein